MRDLGEKADKVLQDEAELTPVLGLNSGEADEEMKDTCEDEDGTKIIAVGGMPDSNIDPGTFFYENPANQELASSSNSTAEQLLGLVYTEASMLHAKEALKSILEDVMMEMKTIMHVKEEC